VGNGVVISAAVEGIVDEALARALIVFAGAIPGPTYGKEGKPFLRQRIAGYNAAARHAPWLVLVDLDREHDCAPALRAAWLPQRVPRLCFRVAVRAIEAWLLADVEQIAVFLSVAREKVPRDPEALTNPKAALVQLARGSRRKGVREDIVPRDGSGRSVGPAYASRLIEFISTSWRPHIAAQQAASLQRAIDCLKWLATLT